MTLESGDTLDNVGEPSIVRSSSGLEIVSQIPCSQSRRAFEADSWSCLFNVSFAEPTLLSFETLKCGVRWGDRAETDRCERGETATD